MSIDYCPSPEELEAYSTLMHNIRDVAPSRGFSDLAQIPPVGSVQLEEFRQKLDQYKARVVNIMVLSPRRYVDTLIKVVVTGASIQKARTDGQYSIYSRTDARNDVYESGVTERPEAYHGLVMRYWAKRFETDDPVPLQSIEAEEALRMTTEITDRVFTNLRGYTRSESVVQPGTPISIVSN